jgi:hypothetical protein
MKKLIALTLVGILSTPAFAQQVAEPTATVEEAGLDLRFASDVTLGEFLWVNRLIVVFADSPRDPSFLRQMELLALRPETLLDRDVVVITDTDPATPSAIRTKLRPRGFGFVLIDKDGVIKLRKPSPWDVREISRSIDKTDLRQQEIRDARAAE